MPDGDNSPYINQSSQQHSYKTQHGSHLWQLSLGCSGSLASALACIATLARSATDQVLHSEPAAWARTGLPLQVLALLKE